MEWKQVQVGREDCREYQDKVQVQVDHTQTFDEIRLIVTKRVAGAYIIFFKLLGFARIEETENSPAVYGNI